ncbi:hypothetical protein ACIGD1_34430 [Streptomyces sp. NPDC085612]|uniref:hypothetical protein n=1 Tax=Streptomyces sp. NPDC085612 TaxID=3365732 RepID=UPI0037D01D47
MAGTRTTIAEQFGRTAVGTEVDPAKRTVQAPSAGDGGTEDYQSSRQLDEKTNSLPPVFKRPQSEDRAERLAHCQGAILSADSWAQQATEAVTQQYLLMTAGAYELVRTEELWQEGGFESFDAWGRILNGHGSDYMNKVIRIGPVVRALATITRRQLKEQPLRPLVSVQRTHGDDATRRCWQEAERVGDLTERGLLAAAVKLGYKVEIEPAKKSPTRALEPAKLNVATLRKLSSRDPEAALEACRDLRRELDGLEAELTRSPDSTPPTA